MPAAKRKPRSRFIYALLDSRERIRYVGQSTNPQGRFAAITDLRRPNATGPLVRHWVDRHVGEIELRVLEKCNDMDDRESFWIAKLREEGRPLLNIQPGGDYHTEDARSTVEQMKRVLRMLENSDSDPEDVVFLNALIKQSETKIRLLSQRQKRRKRRTARSKLGR